MTVGIQLLANVGFKNITTHLKINYFCLHRYSAAPLRHNFKHAYCLWPPVLFSPLSTVYSLDQRLKSGVWCRDRHVNKVSQECRGLHCQLFFHVLFYHMSFDTIGLLTRGLHSMFSTLPNYVLQSILGGRSCGNIYHLLHSGRCSHDVSTFCPFLFEAQDRWTSIGQGNCCQFNMKTAAFPTSVLHENVPWSHP